MTIEVHSLPFTNHLLLWTLIIPGGGEDKPPTSEEVSLYDALRSSIPSSTFYIDLDTFVEI